MHLLKTTLIFAATVSAIDFRFYWEFGCGGPFVACRNSNPNECCVDFEHNHLSMSMNAIPSDWNIQVQGLRGCDTVVGEEASNGRTDVCLDSEVSLNGAKYFFRSRKRAIDSCGAKSDCTPQKPNVLGLQDGQLYDISQLNDSLLKTLTEYAINGTTAEDIPEVYKSLVITE